MKTHKKISSIYTRACILILIGIGIFLTSPAPLRADGDLFCNCNNQRYGTPGECVRNCTGNRLRCTGCFLSPRCEAMNIPAFKQLYNMWILKGPRTADGFPGQAGLMTISAYIVNNFYQPYRSSDFHIIILSGERSFFAKIEQPSSPGGKPILNIHRELFLMSPAFLISAIGHEMVHAIQFEQQIDVDLKGIYGAHRAFLELEASEWESWNKDFDWKIGFNDVYDCLLELEKESSQKTLECRRWQVRYAIETAAFNPVNLNKLEKWLKANPWTRDVWLPKNPNWKSFEAGARPDGDCEPF